MKGCSSWRQVRRGCVFSAGRSVFWCPLVGAESDSCGRNGPWKGLIFRHNRVHVQNQGAVLRKSSPRGVHPTGFPARQGENECRPTSLAHFTLDENGYPVVSPNDQGALCCVVYPFFISNRYSVQEFGKVKKLAQRVSNKVSVNASVIRLLLHLRVKVN